MLNDVRVTASQLRISAPGAVFAIALAVTAKMTAATLEHWRIFGAQIPISSVLMAILLGMIWRNLVGVPARFEAGLHWVMNHLMRAGIALVGLRLTLAGVTGILAIAAPVAIGCICTGLLVGLGAARMLGISHRLGYLLAVGTSVCGCTAVVALSPVVRAQQHETGYAIACVVLFGCLGMLLHPTIAQLLFASSPVYAGVFLGTSIHDTSQVIGAGLIYSQQYSAPEALMAASVTKLLRNLSIALIIPAAAWLQLRNRRAVDVQARTWIQRPPTFIVAFVALMIIRGVGDAYFGSTTAVHAWIQITSAGERICDLLLICGMTAVGLSVSLGQLRSVGLRPLTVAALVAVAVSLCSACLTTLMYRYFA